MQEKLFNFTMIFNVKIINVRSRVKLLSKALCMLQRTKYNYPKKYV